MNVLFELLLDRQTAPSVEAERDRSRLGVKTCQLSEAIAYHVMSEINLIEDSKLNIGKYNILLNPVSWIR